MHMMMMMLLFILVAMIMFLLLPLVLVRHLEQVARLLVLHGPLHLGNVLYVEQDLPLDRLHIGRVALELQLAPSLRALHLLGLLGELVLHVVHFAAVYLLDLLVLVLDDRDVLLLRTALLAELLRVFLRRPLVFPLHLALLCLSSRRNGPDLLPQLGVLSAHSLGLLLEPPLFSLELGSKLDMVLGQLAVEDLLLLQLLEAPLHLLLRGQEPKALLLLESRARVAELSEHPFEMQPLLLDLLVQLAYLGAHLLRLIIRKVDSSQHVRRLIVVADCWPLLVLLN